MEIKIIERYRDETTKSFDLIVDEITILEDTGLDNCIEMIVPSYSDRLKELNEMNNTKE